MQTPTDNVSLKVTFNVKTGELGVDTNATPPELLRMITAVQVQLCPVFQDLEKALVAIQEKRDKPAPSLILPFQAGKVIAAN